MKSFAVLRTNTALTSNVKIMVDSDYKLSLNSIETNVELEKDKYKNVDINVDNFYDELLCYFYDGLDKDFIFDIKNDDDIKISSKKYHNQYSDLYQYGAKDISLDKNYKEDFEYFAPLYIGKTLPKYFIILKIKGNGVDTLYKDNIHTKILQKFETVKLYDLTNKTKLGQWLELNYTNNSNLPVTPFEMSFENLEFSKWYGIDCYNGGYGSKSIFMEEYYNKEKEIFEFERYITNGYKNNSLIFPNLINLSFLFNSDDTWGFNRYFGFYLNDMVMVKKLLPNIPNQLRNDVIVQENNILYSPSNECPFLYEHKDFIIEYLGELYTVEKKIEYGSKTLHKVLIDNIYTDVYKNEEIVKYKIVSEINLLNKQDELNKNLFNIKDNILYDNNGELFQLDMSSADIWLLNIRNKYYNIYKNSNGMIYINSDDIINTNSNDTDNYIYKIEFTDIKDFDTKIIDTDFSKYEYERYNELSISDESKMYLTDLKSTTNPKDIETFSFNSETVNIPVSSEYTANHETFKIINGNLSDIWKKNSIYSRWGYMNSISSNDKPYLLNNSLIFEDFNRTSNVMNPIPDRSSRNLDYFYTINAATSSYTHHSLHIENYDIDGLDTDFTFNLESYLKSDDDYFESFFHRKTNFSDNVKKVRKYSYFNSGIDKPNTTLFRGIQLSIYDIDNINRNIELRTLNTLNLNTNNRFDGYKFSILVTDNNEKVVNNSYTVIPNETTWQIFDDFKPNKLYKENDLVLVDDILYKAKNDNIISNPLEAPYNSSSWDLESNGIFWNPYNNYALNSWVYNSKEFYCKKSNGVNGNGDFWNPKIIYGIDKIVLFNNKYYKSTKNNNNHRPDNRIPESIILNNDGFFDVNYYWMEISINEVTDIVWDIVELWDNRKVYIENEYVVYNNILYKCIELTTQATEPDMSSDWLLIKDIYNNDDIMYRNNVYYKSLSNFRLDNGINIYINHKFKNILLNINYLDNTLPNLRNTNRDDLYNKIYSDLTACNVIKAVNDVCNNYGFANSINYIIIETDGKIKNYSFDNIEQLPYYIVCDIPTEIKLNGNIIKTNALENPIDIKVDKKLKGQISSDMSNIEYYNNSILSVNKTENKTVHDIYTDTIYRFGGFYSPIFYEIELFSTYSNFLFDFNYTDFGIIKERKIQKVNHKKNILSENAVYPMIQDFGYDIQDFFIFKSNWDNEYYNYHDKDIININIENLSIGNIGKSTNLNNI